MRAVALVLSVLALFSCKKKVEVAVRPEPPAPSVPASASAAPSVVASASASVAPITQCTLLSPLGDGQGSSSDEWAADWKMEKVGTDDLEKPFLHLDRGNTHLSVTLEANAEGLHGVWPRRVAIASEGERMQALLFANERDDCGSCITDWPAGTCTCIMSTRDSVRPPQINKMAGDPALRVVTKTGGALDLKPLSIRGGSQIGEPDVGAMVLTSVGSLAVYRSTGALWAVPLKNDGTVAEGVTESILIDGGDMTTPTLTTGKIDGAERVFILFGRRPKPKEPRELRVGTFDPIANKAFLPKPVKHQSVGTAAQPAIVRDGESFALAWFEYDAKADQSHLFFGRGAKPADAAAAAIEIGAFGGEATETTLRMHDGTPRVGWTTAKSMGSSLVVCPKT
jgi:hypothetical protein